MPDAVANYLVVFGVLLIAGTYLDRIGDRLRVPGVLLVLILGLLTDNDISALPGETPPLLSLEHASDIAQVAVGVVLLGLLLQGFSLVPLARRLDLVQQS